jgi:hypothetical protein
MKMPKIGLGKNTSINFLQRSQQGLMRKNTPLTLPHVRVAKQAFFNAS